jgi:hypothetical protein
MSKKIKRVLTLLAASCLACCVLCVTVAWAQEMPAPGTVIDKNNYKKYAHLFPKEFFPAFETGFNGFWKPLVMKVVGKPNVPGHPEYPSQPLGWYKLGEKNKGKLGMDAAGNITGGYDYIGPPFIDVKPDDKDFCQKFMANQYYRYQWDTSTGAGDGAWDAEKRRGERVKNVNFRGLNASFTNRLVFDPKPFYKTPTGLISAAVTQYIYPNSMLGMQMTNQNYLDPRKPDEVYMFLPTMRRVIRGDSSQRSTPIAGTTQAYDDFNGGFAGKFYDFTYKLLGEQKVLASIDQWMDPALSKKQQAEMKDEFLPYTPEGYSIQDVWIIEIHGKDPKYPQSKKIIWIDKKSFVIYYSVAWDRAGEIWKVWFTNFMPQLVASGDAFVRQANQSGIDVQFGYATYFTADWKKGLNERNLKYEDFLPAAMLMRGR